MTTPGYLTHRQCGRVQDIKSWILLLAVFYTRHTLQCYTYSMNITLAIPNYNGLPNLKILLPRVIQEQYAAIYLLDDASTDETRSYVQRNFPTIKVITGTKNLGPGGNRNRIIEHVNTGIIHFLDADMELAPAKIVPTIKNLFAELNVSLIGGLILNKSGEPMAWNYGHDKHPVRDSAAVATDDLLNIFNVPEIHREAVIAYSQAYSFNPAIRWLKPTRHDVDWVAEGNLMIRAETFAAVQGFDTSFRYHESPDLCKRIRNHGQRIIFSPEVSARHLEVEVRSETRQQDWWDGHFRYYQKHWGMSRKIFDLLFPDQPQS